MIFVLKAAGNPKAMEAYLITWHLNPIKMYHKGRSVRVKIWCNLPKPLHTADTHHRNLSIHLRRPSYISDEMLQEFVNYFKILKDLFSINLSYHSL